MRDEIARITYGIAAGGIHPEEGTDQILTLLKERVEKALLTRETDEDQQRVYDLLVSSCPDYSDAIAQAQLNKVLEVLS